MFAIPVPLDIKTGGSDEISELNIKFGINNNMFGRY